MNSREYSESSMVDLQLILGDALQATYLLESGVELEPQEVRTLRRAASEVEAFEQLTRSEPQSLAVPPAVIQLVAATESHAHARSSAELREHLRSLSTSLQDMADGQIPSLGYGEVVDRLKFLHDFASASTARILDEVH